MQGRCLQTQKRTEDPLDLATAIRLARGSDWLKATLGELMYEIYLQMCERELGFYENYLATV